MEMTADNLTERHARGSELFALLNAAVHSSSCTPATTLLMCSLSRVPEGPSPEVAPYFPSYGHALVKSALSVWRLDDLAQIRPPPPVILDEKGSSNEFHDGPESN